MIFIFISAISYALDDFGGLYWVDYYGTRYWEWFWFNHLASGPFMVLSVLLFLGAIVTLGIALASKRIGSKKTPYIISMIMMALIFLISFLGMLTLAAVGTIGDYEDWWWDTACYVGNIAPILITLMLIYPLVIISKKKDDEGSRIGHRKNTGKRSHKKRSSSKKPKR